MEETPVPPPLRPRFSLLTLVLMTTIVALAITVAMFYRELGPLRKEVKRLRAEVGELYIEDKSKLHAIQVESDSELEWKWRVWIPEGKRYALHAFGGDVPASEFPTTGGTVYLDEPGEHVVQYIVKRDPKNGGWSGGMYFEHGSVGLGGQPWVEWRRWSATGESVGKATLSFGPRERVVLARRRYTNEDDPPKNPQDPLPGFMLWLEPQ